MYSDSTLLLQAMNSRGDVLESPLDTGVTTNAIFSSKVAKEK